MADDTRLDRLERRLQQVEDELAVMRLVASYGPLVDAGEAEEVAALWTTDGSYDVEGWLMASRSDVDAMVRSDQHQGLIARGCSHFLGPAHVTLAGDRAVAVCESALLLHHDGRFRVWRAGANRFELSRTPDGWQITARVARVLDGSSEARELLATVARPSIA